MKDTEFLKALMIRLRIPPSLYGKIIFEQPDCATTTKRRKAPQSDELPSCQMRTLL